jgi:hypothetical protein
LRGGRSLDRHGRLVAAAGPGAPRGGVDPARARRGRDPLPVQQAPRARTWPRLGRQDRVHDDQGCDRGDERALLIARASRVAGGRRVPSGGSAVQAKSHSARSTTSQPSLCVWRSPRRPITTAASVRTASGSVDRRGGWSRWSLNPLRLRRRGALDPDGILVMRRAVRALDPRVPPSIRHQSPSSSATRGRVSRRLG